MVNLYALFLTIFLMNARFSVLIKINTIQTNILYIFSIYHQFKTEYADNRKEVK